MDNDSDKIIRKIVDNDSDRIIYILYIVKFFVTIIVALLNIGLGVAYCVWHQTTTGLLLIFLSAPLSAFACWLSLAIIIALLEEVVAIHHFSFETTQILKKISKQIEGLDSEFTKKVIDSNAVQQSQIMQEKENKPSSQNQSIKTTEPVNQSKQSNTPNSDKNLQIKLCDMKDGSVPLIKLYNKSIDDNSFDE